MKGGKYLHRAFHNWDRSILIIVDLMEVASAYYELARRLSTSAHLLCWGGIMHRQNCGLLNWNTNIGKTYIPFKLPRYPGVGKVFLFFSINMINLEIVIAFRTGCTDLPKTWDITGGRGLLKVRNWYNEMYSTVMRISYLSAFSTMSRYQFVFHKYGKWTWNVFEQKLNNLVYVMLHSIRMDLDWKLSK